jgi:hypothetical protein
MLLWKRRSSRSRKKWISRLKMDWRIGRFITLHHLAQSWTSLHALEICVQTHKLAPTGIDLDNNSRSLSNTSQEIIPRFRRLKNSISCLHAFLVTASWSVTLRESQQRLSTTLQR